MKPQVKGLWVGLAIGIPVGIVLTLIVGLVGVLAIGSWMQSQTGRRHLPVPLFGAEFPELGRRSVYGRTDYDWTLRTLDGAEASFAEFRGRPVFLNVWATWCGPCVSEMPSIERLHRSIADDDIAVVLVTDESADTVRDFLASRNLSLPVYLTPEEVPVEFASPGIPATFVVDPGGLILFRHVGAANWDDDACREFLRSLS